MGRLAPRWETPGDVRLLIHDQDGQHLREVTAVVRVICQYGRTWMEKHLANANGMCIVWGKPPTVRPPTAVIKAGQCGWWALRIAGGIATTEHMPCHTTAAGLLTVHMAHTLQQTCDRWNRRSYHLLVTRPDHTCGASLGLLSPSRSKALLILHLQATSGTEGHWMLELDRTPPGGSRVGQLAGDDHGLRGGGGCDIMGTMLTTLVNSGKRRGPWHLIRSSEGTEALLVRVSRPPFTSLQGSKEGRAGSARSTPLLWRSSSRCLGHLPWFHRS